MLILGRRRGQSFYVGDVKVSLRDFAKGTAQIEITAPKDVRVIPMEFLFHTRMEEDQPSPSHRVKETD